MTSQPVTALSICSMQAKEAQTAFNSPVAHPLVLRDMEGKLRSLSDYKGKGTVVYFFCGCEWCQSCAHEWSDMQKEGALPLDATEKPLQTLMVFAGDTAATRAFAASTGLDTKQNLLLPDPDLHVTTDYRAAECPRVFVIDGDGFVRYTNNHQYDAPRKAPALVIVSNAVGALRAAMAAPISLAPLSPARPEPVNPFNLSVVFDEGLDAKGASSGHFDFGIVDTLKMPRIEHTFTLRNDNKIPIVIQRLGASCGCTSVLVKNEHSAQSATKGLTLTGRTLLPGQTTQVRVSVDTSQLHSGATKKLVWVFAQGSANPAATLELAATFKAPVTFSSAVLNFGKVKGGTSSFLSLSASFDVRLLDGSNVPDLICTNPDIVIIPDAAEMPAGMKVKQQSGSPQAAAQAKNGFVTRTYTIKLSPQIPLGPLQGSLSCVVIPTTIPTDAKTRFAPVASILGAPSLVIGEVVGRVAAMPSSINFGTASVGEHPVQAVKLTGPLALLKRCRVDTEDTNFTARVIKPVVLAHSKSTSNENTSLELEVSLHKQALPGVIQSRVIVTFADGTRLVLPVWINLVK